MSQFGIYFDQTRCIGCRTCMVACKDHNGINPGKAALRKFYEFEEGNDTASLNAGFMVHGCNHCSSPACMSVCPTNAIKKRLSDGIVLIDRTLCNGCGQCVTACPWQMPQIAQDDQEPEKDPRWITKHPAQKCTLCFDRLQIGKNPVCADACIMRAIEVGPIEYLNEKHHGSTASAKGFPYGATGPSVKFKSK